MSEARRRKSSPRRTFALNSPAACGREQRVPYERSARHLCILPQKKFPSPSVLSMQKCGRGNVSVVVIRPSEEDNSVGVSASARGPGTTEEGRLENRDDAPNAEQDEESYDAPHKEFPSLHFFFGASRRGDVADDPDEEHRDGERRQHGNGGIDEREGEIPHEARESSARGAQV